jgi:hypothetical protein
MSSFQDLMDTTPTPRIERLTYFDSEDVEPQIPIELQEYTSQLTALTLSSDEPNPREEEDLINEGVDVSIPGFNSLAYIYGTSEERVYTLVGTDASGVEKRIRFAPGTHGRARLRLRHELDVLTILAEYRVPQIPEIEKIQYFPDRGLCVVYPFVPVRTFQEYLDELMQKSYNERIGDILKFAQSLAKTLSATHMAGVFRKKPLWRWS